MKICILTAGKGTRMGVSSKQINKALLPIDHKAVISHIIEKFSIDDVFVIALGYKGDQVINYLKSAHPKNKFEFVDFPIKNYDPFFNINKQEDLIEATTIEKIITQYGELL